MNILELEKIEALQLLTAHLNVRQAESEFLEAKAIRDQMMSKVLKEYGLNGDGHRFDLEKGQIIVKTEEKEVPPRID